MTEETVEDITKRQYSGKGVLQFRVGSLGEYCDLVEHISFTWREEERRRAEAGELRGENSDFPGELSPWFRGITREEHELEPGILRKNYTIPGSGQTEKNGIRRAEDRKHRIRKAEDYMFRRFRVLGLPLLPEKSQLQSFHWLFVMQHHGVKTRLLDWSRSSLIALFFAIRKYEERGKRLANGETAPDAAVWMLEPRRLSEACGFTRRIPDLGVPDECIQEHLERYKDLKNLKDLKNITDPNKLRERSAYENIEKPIKLFDAYPAPIIPEQVVDRLISQWGRFTLHTRRKNGLVRFAKHYSKPDQDGRWYLVKIIVPLECHKPLLRALRTAGISEIPITQDLDGVAKEILQSLRLGSDGGSDEPLIPCNYPYLKHESE